MSPFERAMAFVLKYEGGYSNDPNDPGGETKWGISKRAHPELDIKNLTLEEAKRIYYTDYWLPSGAADMPEALAIAHMDTSVNLGVGRAKKLLSEAGGDLERYLALRLNFYTTLSTWAHFGKGWTRRVADLLRYVDEEREGKRLKIHQDGQFASALEIPAGKRAVIAVEPDGSINRDIRGS